MRPGERYSIKDYVGHNSVAYAKEIGVKVGDYIQVSGAFAKRNNGLWLVIDKDEHGFLRLKKGRRNGVFVEDGKEEWGRYPFRARTEYPPGIKHENLANAENVIIEIVKPTTRMKNGAARYLEKMKIWKEESENQARRNGFPF